MTAQTDNLIHTRYSRQALFEPLGERGQRRLMAGRAVLIGCGGLGTVLASILVRAGIGFLRIVDRDILEESNLQRQVLFDTADCEAGLPKAEAARRKLAAVNPHVEIDALVQDADASCMIELVRDVDVILDGTDNYGTRYLINDAAVSLGKPWIMGAAAGSTGLTTTIVPGRTPCLRCLYEIVPPPASAPTSATVGILGSVVHVIAAAQAMDAVRLLVKGVEEVRPRFLSVDVWEGKWRTVSLKGARQADCVACGRRVFEFLDGVRGSHVAKRRGRIRAGATKEIASGEEAGDGKAVGNGR